MIQRCVQCDARFSLGDVIYTCAECGGVLEILLGPDDLASPRFVDPAVARSGVWRYAPLLPVGAAESISLGEGGTGLHACPRLAGDVGMATLYVKNEGENPTGSFKDRGMTVGVAQAMALGAKAVACASTGNTAASLAAYAARAGLRAIVLVPGGNVAMGKLAQSVVHGAEIAQVEGNFDDAMQLVHRLSTDTNAVYLLNSINPFRLEGQKTLAFEVCERLGRAPDVVVLPLGNAGNISAIWKGFCEFRQAGITETLPRMIGVQAQGAAPIARMLNDGAAECRIPDPETIATAIRIGAPVNWQKAVAAIRESGGCAGTVTDDEILRAQRRLAQREGLFVEPASAAPIAYLQKTRVDAETVVCVATGHGLKDPDAILRGAPTMMRVAPTMASLREALEI